MSKKHTKQNSCSELSGINRRSVLQSAAVLAAGQLVLNAVSALAASPKVEEVPPGKPGDFDFLAGSWVISHRRLKPDTQQWDEFKGEATCWTILGGVGSVEELRIPSRDFSGMGLRLLDLKQHQWCDYWVNGKQGVLTPPPMTGYFKEGSAIFTADDEYLGKPIKVRGVWDRISPKSCRWHQATSSDNGKTWVANWYMTWVRAG